MKELIFYMLCLIIILLCIGFILYHFHTLRTMRCLEDMINAAIEGSFSEHIFDESRLSALESRFAKYLSASETSFKNTAMEKDKIKTLISDISHQTKTPISNILLYSELLAEQNLTEESKQYVSALTMQTEKLKFLITSLVKLSRLETGILTLSPRKAPVFPMLETLARQYAPLAKEKGLFLSLPEMEQNRNSFAIFDEKWTTEAIGNLIDNAIKYTEKGGITLSVISYEMFLCIQVKDTGIGIPEEEHTKIFSRFYRSESVHEKPGVGIGLFLTREIIMLEGGYIKVSSIPGKGSAFSIFLPL
ncbi:MAG: HAMP domain-containing histidine kinase [Lachnospiraceae bacterium]|jgi:two-component system sensor histidine kinase ResE|nr:HAMP domain-containing histidine kinase [Lachnospiraceae bacterium]